MNQPAPAFTARVAVRAAVRRAAPVVLVLLLALLGTTLGSGHAAGRAMETRLPASAPADPLGEGHAEESDTTLSSSSRAGRAGHRQRHRVRIGAPYVVTRPGQRPGPGPVHSTPYRPGRPGDAAELPLPLRAVRCMDLRC